MAPRAPATAALQQPTRDDMLALIRAHGASIMAYSKLQPGLEHFHVPDVGAVSFCVMQVGPPFLFKNRPAVLGDPLCAPSDRERLTRLFLEKHPRSFFVQVSRDYALLLQRQFGIKATCMGGETELDLAGGYDLSGAAKHPIRNAAAGAEREGVWVEELLEGGQEVEGGKAEAIEVRPPSSSASSSYPPSRLESQEVQRGLRAVDAAWAATKGARHAARIWFINRAPVFGREPGVRKFVAWQHKEKQMQDDGGGAAETDDADANGAAAAAKATAGREMVAYIFFDPVYRDGRVRGVYANVTRISPSAPPGCLNLIMSEAMRKFKGELEREAAAVEATRGGKRHGGGGGAADDDGADDLAPRDQDDREEAPPQQKLSRKERIALKQAALAARGVSDEELRLQRAAKKKAPQPPPAAAAEGSSSNNTAANTPNANNNNNAKKSSSSSSSLPPFFVSLGMAPFFALSGGGEGGTGGQGEDPEIPGEPSAARVMGWVYEHGQTFYPYKAIAFSKTRYGGGLDEASRTFPRDRHALWRPVYAASSLDAPTFVALFDLGALVGFWRGPFDAIGTFVRYEWSGLKARVAARFAGSGGKGRREHSGGLGGGEEAAPLAPHLTPSPAPPPPPAPLDVPPPRSPSFASAASAPGSVAAEEEETRSGSGLSSPADAVASVADADYDDSDGGAPQLGAAARRSAPLPLLPPLPRRGSACRPPPSTDE